VELLRFFDNASPGPGRPRASAAETRAADGSPPMPDVPALTGTGGPRADSALTEHLDAPPQNASHPL